MAGKPNLLAIDGGAPVRVSTLPYGKQTIDDTDVNAVTNVLQSAWLTTGPKVPEFEAALASVTESKYAVAVSSGTAALHTMMYAVGVGPGDEVIVPSMTFAATANCALYVGATPVFADIDPGTLLIDPVDVDRRITSRTKAIIAVDYAGQPADYDALREIANRHDLVLCADACHALGGSENDRPVGSLADISVFSFHPVKPITTGEGGMLTTDNETFATRARLFRNHGIDTDHRQRESVGTWLYEMVDLGYNYRMTDIQCALGLSQLGRLADFTKRRQDIASLYNSALSGNVMAEPLAVRDDITHAYHLYIIRLNLKKLRVDRAHMFAALRAEGIGVNVHYIPVHLHPYYRDRFGYKPGLCPVAETAYERILSLPIFPTMSNDDVADVTTALKKVCEAYLTPPGQWDSIEHG